jgi:hypothetical protein
LSSSLISLGFTSHSGSQPSSVISDLLMLQMPFKRLFSKSSIWQRQVQGAYCWSPWWTNNADSPYIERIFIAGALVVRSHGSD